MEVKCKGTRKGNLISSLTSFANRAECSDSAPNAAIGLLQQQLLDHKDTLRVLVDDIDGIKRLLSSKSTWVFGPQDDKTIFLGNSETGNMPPELRLNQLENKTTDFLDQLNSLDHMFCRQVEILQKRITDLEKDAGELVEKVNLG